MKFIVIVAVLFASLLSGCVHNEVKVVEQHTYTLYEPDPAYLGDCITEPPPSKKEYMVMSMDQREDALTKLAMAQTQNLAKCTLDKQSIRNSLTKSRALIQKKNDEEQRRISQELEKLGAKNGQGN